MSRENNTLTPKAIRELLADAVRSAEREFTHDDLHDLVPRLGEQVFSLDWDSGGPGCAGEERVYRLGELYLTASDSFGWGGPYPTLDEACGTIHVTGATVEISCSEWTDDEIIARMKLSSPRPWLVINGTEWPLERLEQRHARLRGGGVSGGRDGDGPAAGDVVELIMHPVVRTPDGDVFRAEPPADPADIPVAELREAIRLVREGELALERRTRDLPVAELRLREALDRYLVRVDEPHPRVSYVLDRIGVACHQQGRLAEAEVLYRRSLQILAVQDGPTRWNDVTILNLARLLAAQGRDDERDEVMAWYQP